MRTLKYSLSFVLISTLGLACGTDDASNGDDSHTPPGIEIRDIEPGDECPGGGIEIRHGEVDDQGEVNDDGLLENQVLCDGVDGADGADGAPLLVETSVVSPGETCAAGGKEIRMGHDLSESGELEADEIAESIVLCHGEDADLLLIEAMTIEEDPCPEGGQRIDYGYDIEGDGTLHEDHIVGAYHICHGVDGDDGQDGTDGQDGASPVMATDVVTPGSECPTGGIELTYGLDTSGDGQIDIDQDEVTICNGESGPAGDAAFIETESVDPGDECPAGGVSLTYGIDTSGDGTIDEVQGEDYICHGEDAPPIVFTTSDADSDNCPAGGIQLQIGLDTTGDDEIDDPQTSQLLCNGVDGDDGDASLIDVVDIDPGDTCDAGGLELTFGIDTSSDGEIDSAEMVRTLCNGVDGQNGQDGEDGEDGDDGISAAVDTAPISSGDSTCPAGGVEITFGLDESGDGSVDTVSSTTTLCNGEDGQDGDDGQDGQDADGGGAIVIDDSGEEVGIALSTSALEVTVVTSAGYLIDLYWDGTLKQNHMIEYTGSGCSGDALFSFFQESSPAMYSRYVAYDTANNRIFIPQDDASGIVEPDFDGTINSFVSANNLTCENQSDASTGVFVEETTRSAVGLPASPSALDLDL